jgi:malate dehydrogenase (oxaloacetate-decarboxylating)(NADP+)
LTPPAAKTFDYGWTPSNLSGVEIEMAGFVLDLNKFPKGMDLLKNSILNKGTAFTEEEREALAIRGLLPPRVHTMESQLMRVLENIRNKETDLEKYIYLMSLQDRNETLFTRLILENIEEFMPIVYTPTVGKACLAYTHIFRRARGMFIASKHRGRIRELLENWPQKDVQVIVVTDGERILGLGDLGADGMGIPVGKLALYTACAGIHPSKCLPITLDVGTDNETLLKDPLYIGMQHRRWRDGRYDDLIEEFIMAVQDAFPQALIQFEDFGNCNAFRLLARYHDTVCCFNDDIQGTAAVALGGLLAAIKITGSPLKEQKILFMGAGEASIGIGELVVAALVDEGMDQAEAMRHCWFVDSKGLLVRSRDGLSEHKKRVVNDHAPIGDFLSAVRELEPTAIIGACGQAGAFSPDILKAMAELNDNPIVFALSNPTDNSECTAREAYNWTQGRAVFASGSPFGPVKLQGQSHHPGQGNNVYIFPAMGLATTACGITRITQEMFLAAARALSGLVSEKSLNKGSVYPPLSDIRHVTLTIAVAVAELAYNRGLASRPQPDDLKKYIQSNMFEPVYEIYV